MELAVSQKQAYCIRVEPFMIEALWDKCLPFLQNPEIGDVEYNSLEDVKSCCISEEYQLWILMKDDELTGCFLTNIGEAASNVRILNIFNLSGEGLKIWIKELDKKISDFAMENDCKFYSCVARPGFSRFVPELKEAGRFYVKELKGDKNV